MVPARPQGLEFERRGAAVCMPKEDFTTLLRYIEELRGKMKEEGAVDGGNF